MIEHENDNEHVRILIVLCSRSCINQSSGFRSVNPTNFYCISDDYPPTQRFREDTKRKIITCLPKKKDDRLFKLNFENLIDELQQL